MDRKTILRIFGDAFLRSLVVLMGIVIIGFSAFFIITVVTNNQKMKEFAQGTESGGEELSPEELEKLLSEHREKEEAQEREQTTEATTTEEVTTEAPTTEEKISSMGYKILVLNSTRVSGLAKKWMEKLKSEGFTDIATGNYSAAREEETKIYVPSANMGDDLLVYFNNATIEIGALSSGMDVSAEGVEIFIVIGATDTTIP